ncbi:hypothetical protein PISMIDRAFT_122540 [Pisolithus microcarpus 441]|uniref:Uncharacterized protein n=1 Tax=Pisolithus microcarpus 441 TaxID=765257 RepID=A0A0C9Y360_9AGAM|nr:hypothetical protein PISMIDRAFT_122540 [Pisolithus microcarpus 441]
MTLTSSKANNGFLEGIVHGYKAGILTQSHCTSLTQCETLEGMPFSPPRHHPISHATLIDLKTQLSTTGFADNNHNLGSGNTATRRSIWFPP